MRHDSPYLEEDVMELDSASEARADRIERGGEERNLARGILCAGCTNGLVMRRRGKFDFIVYCQAMMEPLQVPSDLAECSDFKPKNEMPLHEMKNIALPVDGRKGIDDKSYL